MRKIVFDIETKNTFNEVGSNNATDLDISIICIYDFLDNKYYSFLEEELCNLWPIIEKADLLIGYNSDYFDIPLLNKYYQGDLTQIKSLDILKEIQKALGKRVRLDQVAEATLGENKSSHGLQAVTWWKRGEIEKIRKYCLDDVRITKEIYDFAIKNNYLKYALVGEKKIIKLDTSAWEEKSDESIMNQSLF